MCLYFFFVVVFLCPPAKDPQEYTCSSITLGILLVSEENIYCGRPWCCSVKLFERACSRILALIWWYRGRSKEAVVCLDKEVATTHLAERGILIFFELYCDLVCLCLDKFLKWPCFVWFYYGCRVTLSEVVFSEIVYV